MGTMLIFYTLQMGHKFNLTRHNRMQTSARQGQQSSVFFFLGGGGRTDTLCMLFNDATFDQGNPGGGC